MFYNPRLYFRDWWINSPLIVIVIAQIYIWWLLIANIHPGMDQIFLHYNIIFGVDMVGDWWKIFYLPVVGLVVFVINYFFSFFLYSKDKFLSRLLSMWVLVFHIFLITAVYLLVRLNT